MTRPLLIASLKLWKRRLKYRQGRLRHWARKQDTARIAKWTRLVNHAEQRVRLRRGQLARPIPAKGIDVSNHQGRVDFAQVRRAGYTFAWLKASEASTFTDRFFLDNVRRARAAGLKVGAYHFLHTGNIAAQAAHFIGLIRAAGLGRGDLLPVIDAETVANGRSPTTADVAAFADAVQHELRVRPLIYTFPSFRNWPSTFGCRLWIAHFDVPRPTIPAPWRRYAAWQHSSTASVPGVAGHCDVNKTSDLREVVW